MYIILKIDLLTSLTTSTCSDFIQDSVSLLVAFVPFLATFYVSRGDGHKGMAHVQSFRPRAAASMKSVPVTVMPRQLGVRHQQRAAGQFYGGNQVNSTNLSRVTSSFLLGAESPALSARSWRPSRFKQFSEVNTKEDLWHSPTAESANPAEEVLPEALVAYCDPSETDEALARRLMLSSQVEAAMKAAAIRSEAAKGPVNLRFYNRAKDMKCLREKLAKLPEDVLLIVGPKNCGKSRLKTELLSRDTTNQRIIHVDLGLEAAPTPKDMAQQLQKLIMERRRDGWSWLDVSLSLVITAAEKLSGFKFLPEEVRYGMEMSAAIGKMVKKGFFNKEKAELGDLAHIQKSFLALLETLSTCGTVSQEKYPVIIIDEVNRLMEWQQEYSNELTGFVDFLQRISKQAQKAHVVLLTSESFMVSWLQRGNGDTIFKVMVLGNLSAEEAEKFVRGGKIKDVNGEEEFWPGWISQYPKLQMNDDEWKKVFKACGGSIWDLSRCVNSAGSTESWQEGIKSILIQPARRVRDITIDGPDALVPPISAGPALWTADHYKAVVPLIVESEHHAVPVQKAAAALEPLLKVPMPEGVDARKILFSMVKWNVLNIRPYFELAKDIPRQAFGPEDVEEEELDDVVTMPSSAHLRTANKWVEAEKN